MTFSSLRSSTEPPPASAAAGWRLHQHPPAPVQPPQPDLRPRRRGTPAASAGGGSRLARVPPSAQRGASLQGHCDRGGRRPACRQQLAVRRRCFLQLGHPRRWVATTTGLGPRPPAVMDRKYKLTADVKMFKKTLPHVASLGQYLAFASFMFET